MSDNVLSFSDVVINYTALLGAMFTSGITISLFLNRYKYPDGIKNATLKHIASAAISFYAISMISMCTYHMIANDKTSLMYTVGWEIFAFFWGIANCLSYILFILRLKTTFESTVFNTANWVYISMYFCVIIFFLANICVQVIFALKYENCTDAQLLSDIHTTELIAKFIVDIYLSSTLTYLFVSKLMQLSLMLFTNQMKEYHLPSISVLNQASNSDSKISLSRISENDETMNMMMKLTKHDRTYLLIANKMTVLSVTMALSTEFVICVALLSSEMGDKFMNGFLWYFGVMFFLIIDSMINTLCIYASLPYPTSRKVYKCCCKCCDRCCMYCATKRLQNKKIKTVESDINANQYILMQEMDL